MSLIDICKNDTTQATQDFAIREFYSKSSNAPACHTLSDKLIQAVQYIRTYYNIPICITSTYRTKRANDLLGSNENSQHRTPEGAVDFQACDSEQRDYLIGQLYVQFKEKGEVYQELRDIGINGFGFYDSFTHIDVRANYTGEVDFWDDTSGKYGDITLDGKKKNPINRLIDSFGGEDGLADYKKPILRIAYGLIIMLVILIILTLIIKK